MSPGISCLSSFPGGSDPPPSHIRPFAPLFRSSRSFRSSLSSRSALPLCFFCLSSFPGESDPPPFHHSIIPSFHHSIISSFHHSIIPASLTSAFLRLLVRGDVFSVKTVASAWGSGREGARGAPVFEENTSAKGFRASKPSPRARLKTPGLLLVNNPKKFYFSTQQQPPLPPHPFPYASHAKHKVLPSFSASKRG